MSEHLHSEFVPGCYRCDLSADEVIWIRFRRDASGDPVTCPQFVDDGLTLKCDRCGWWRSTHA